MSPRRSRAALAGEIVGTPGMTPQFEEVSPGPDFACYADGTFPVAWGDYDADGFPDLPLYHNNGDGTFSEIPGFRSILNHGNYHGATWGDYNDDGWIDLAILGYNSTPVPSPSLLLENLGDGRFLNVAPALGLDVQGFGETAIWGDYDGDGRLDLFAPYYITSSPGKSFLYHNNGNGGFTDDCAIAGVCLDDLPLGIKPEGAQWADWNGDGYLDFYVAAHLFQNDGTGHFTDVREAVGLPMLFDEGAQFVDYDNDGRLDLYIRSNDGGHLFHNLGDHFEEVTAQAGIPPSLFLWGDSWADVNNDGWPDLVYMRPNGPALLLMNQGDGTFLADPSFSTLDIVADASAWADWDNDGDLDLATRSMCHRFYRNNLDRFPQFPDSWLNVRVVNALGHEVEHGATVRLRRVDISNPYIQTRAVDSGSGELSQSQYAVHFGVDGSGTYELDVTFPSPAGSLVVADKTTDPRLGAIVPSQLANKEITVYRGGCDLIDEPSRPRIGRIFGSNPSCAGDAITLDAGADYPSYLWSTGETLRTITVSPSEQTTYWVSVPNSCAEMVGGYTQRVDPAPTAVLSGGETICSGTSATLLVDLTGKAPWTLTWSDGFEQTAVSSPVTRIVAPESSTTYTLVSVSTATCAAGAAAGSAEIDVTDCSVEAAAQTILADGRPLTSPLPAGGSRFAASLVVGRSYVAEVEVAAGNSAAPFLLITRGDGTTPIAASPVAASDCDPAVVRRLTFLPQPSDLDDGPILVHVHNEGSASYAIRFRLAETTLFCPRWSVNGYQALADIQNTTGCVVTGDLLLLDPDGSPVGDLPFQAPAFGAAQLEIPSDLGIVAGSAVVTHDGPAGALSAGIYMSQPGSGGANFRWLFSEARASEGSH